jgi:hypothetical protein
MMLIYSGQEAALNKKLHFFDKDLIEWGNYPLHNFYQSLTNLIKDNTAFWNGDFGGDFKAINNNMETKVLSFQRIKESSSAICIFNLSAETNILQIQSDELDGNYVEYFSNQKYKIENNHKFVLAPWEYLIFINS